MVEDSFDFFGGELVPTSSRELAVQPVLNQLLVLTRKSGLLEYRWFHEAVVHMLFPNETLCYLNQSG